MLGVATAMRGEPPPEAEASVQSASLLVVPLFHVTGCLSTMTVNYATGAKVVLMPAGRFDPDVWTIDPDGTRRELAWSPGTSARFTPALEVVGPDGAVMAREGWLVVGRCAVGSTGYDFDEFATPPPDPAAGRSAFP